MAEYREEALAAPAAMAAFLAGLGGLGVCLAGIGLYAVVAFAVSRRAREIGIRVALGAPTRKVVGGVAKEMAALVGAGTAIGLFVTVTGIVALRAVDISTPGISIYRPVIDPAGLAALIAFMALVGVAAAYLPARRAARMDPLAALRRD
jgi:ABC-type antimicrobial peptide transport system permease subunit